MTFTIRPFQEADYEAVAAVAADAFPGVQAFSVADLRHWDSLRDAKCKSARWVAEIDGRVVGCAEYSQFVWQYHPQKFQVDAWVHPDHQRQGIGSALYDLLVSALAEFDPISLSCHTREHLAHSVRFLEVRGFAERMRTWESELDLARADLSPFAGVVNEVEKRGVVIKSLRELESDPDRDRKLFELRSVLRMDVPSSEPRSPLTFDDFLRRTLHTPNMLPDGYLIAMENGRYIGQTNIGKDLADDSRLHTGLTGVLREYRGRGIATALKVRSLQWAKESGYASVNTYNESNNRHMLAINVRLGFVRKPAVVEYHKLLRAE